MKIIKNLYILVALIAVTFTLFSCKKFVDIGSPNGTVPAESVFATDASAVAAISALYNSGNWRDGMLYTALLSGMSADELVYFSTGNLLEFQNNSIQTNNAFIANYTWFFPYQEIRNANIAIDGITKSQTITPALKNQLIGEAKFWRAFAFMGMVNLYGGVPLTLSPEPVDNALLPRSSVDEVWAQIMLDLKDAKTLLTPTYPSAERARVNQYAVSALLARAYLYRKDWPNAEAEATAVIGSGVYGMTAPSANFVKTSNETILQIYTLTGFNSWGANYVPLNATSGNPNFYLRSGFVSSFEAGDTRRTNWVAPIGTAANPEYYINKYKLRTATAGNEYYIVLRLAEQYLIRAEARAEQDKLIGTTGGEADLNEVRSRASLLPKLNLSKPAMLLAIEQERKVELFGEYGHRWFDLKRKPSLTDPAKTRADDVLSVIKGANWQSTDVLFPIHQDERVKNPALTQNPGYPN
jgi:hypothetical protein